jgi:hypothetical protein
MDLRPDTHEVRITRLLDAPPGRVFELWRPGRSTWCAGGGVSAAPPERAGAAAALSETSTELGGALGIAVLGSIATAIYCKAMAGVPVPVEVAETARATLGGAVVVAAGLSDEKAGPIADAARDTASG